MGGNSKNLSRRLEDWLSDNSVVALLAISVIALVALAVVVAFFVMNFRGVPISSEAAAWGQFGDYLGGTLNPLFGFLSVIALLGALVIQSRELKISATELRNSARALNAQNQAIEHQSFEQTFFAWLQSYRHQLQAIEIIINTDTGAERRGTRSLYSWWESSLSTSAIEHAVARAIKGGKTYATHEMAIKEKAMEAWRDLYAQWEFYLDALFRNLYRLFLWIDSQSTDRVSPAQKWLYASIVRGQLSWIEMVYLFYNGYTARGAKFKRLVERYALFDNLNFDSDRVLSILRTNPPDKTGYAVQAFSSSEARKALGLPESAEDTLAMAVATRMSAERVDGV